MNDLTLAFIFCFGMHNNDAVPSIDCDGRVEIQPTSAGYALVDEEEDEADHH